MGRFKNLRGRVKQLGPRVSLLKVPEHVTQSPEAAERSNYYASARWSKLRSRLLQGDNRTCFFCGAHSEVLEHLVGHGEDAVQVGMALGLPVVEPDWRLRFWSGPFCGSCQNCARSRSGSERAGKLLRWTQKWLAKK